MKNKFLEEVIIHGLSRRDFLKLCGTSSFGLLLAACGYPPAVATRSQLLTVTPTYTGTPSPTIQRTESPTSTARPSRTPIPSPSPTETSAPTEKPKFIWESPRSLNGWSAIHTIGGKITSEENSVLGKVLKYSKTDDGLNKYRVQLDKNFNPAIRPPFRITTYFFIPEEFSFAGLDWWNLLGVFNSIKGQAGAPDFNILASIRTHSDMRIELAIKGLYTGDDTESDRGSQRIIKGITNALSLRCAPNGNLEAFLNGDSQAKLKSYYSLNKKGPPDEIRLLHGIDLYGVGFRRGDYIFKLPTLVESWA